MFKRIVKFIRNRNYFQSIAEDRSTCYGNGSVCFSRGSVTISRMKQLCAGNAKNGGDSCLGDSGGTLSFYGDVQGSTKMVQHGIVSFGPRLCGSSVLPGIYTRVGHFMKWIVESMKP